MKRLLITILILLFWASPAMAETFTLDCGFPKIDDLPEFRYEIGQFEIEPTKKDKWDKWDTTLLALRIIDWGQTRDIATSKTDPNLTKDDTGYLYNEYNPILGRHPSIKTVNTYFGICIGADILIAKYANPKIHKLWNMLGITLESYCIYHNWQTGIKIKF